MRWLLFFIFLLLGSNVLQACTSREMTKTRNLFHVARTKSKLQTFLTYVKKVDCKNAKPYYASAIMQQAEYTINPIMKLKHFNKGKAMLESFIKKHPNNIEARYVRILVQNSVPSILGYKSNILADKQFIKSELGNSKISASYRKTILKYINS